MCYQIRFKHFGENTVMQNRQVFNDAFERMRACLWSNCQNVQ
jgi:hypothetical protein